MKREFEPFFKWPKVRWPFANPHQWSLDDLLKDEAAAGRMLENLKEELQEIISRVEVLTIFVGFLLDNPGDLQRLAAWKKNRLRLRPAREAGGGGSRSPASRRRCLPSSAAGQDRRAQARQRALDG